MLAEAGHSFQSVRMTWAYCVIASILLGIDAELCTAGPPFKTDDPEPVDFRHWEFYLASEQEFERDATSATCPHLEVNYGAVPEVQAHIVVPMAYAHSPGVTNYGFSDIELGVKWRIVDETDNSPQFGVFPLVTLPTGNKSKSLGQGTTQMFLPLWIQKSWGSLTTYGGAGLWLNPGGKNWVFAGWLLQYDFSPAITFGGEVYVHTPDSDGASAGGGFSLGGFLNIDEHNHILLSGGHDNRVNGSFTGYLGYQVTF
jgi:hypothetical protein